MSQVKGNTGMKYQTQKQNIDTVFAEKGMDFNEWIQRDYDSLISELTSKCKEVNPDIFNDTYSKMHDAVIYRGIDIACYRSYFIRAYYTNWVCSKRPQSQTTSIVYVDSYNNLDRDDSYSFADLDNTDDLQYPLNLIFEDLEQRFPTHEYELYRMYTLVSPTISYRKLAKVTGLRLGAIRRIISSIKNYLNSNKENILKSIV